MRIAQTIGRGRPLAPPNERRRAVRESLTASGVAPAAVLPTIDLSRATTAERYFYAEGLGNGFATWMGDSWPTEETEFDATQAVFHDGHQAVFRSDDGTLALVDAGHGWCSVYCCSPSPSSIGRVFAAFRRRYPPAYLVMDGSRVPITFWTCGPFGASSRLRRLESAAWEDIAGNYSAPVRDELADLMTWSGMPAREGQLFLWQGPPGTGKTWALRALASQWASWAEFHYITDPDVFFVEKPSYMIDVLLSESYDVIDGESGDLVAEDGGQKWRVLILEDTGELLSSTAKEKYGQGLSRLLNVVDGMIGQGLRVLAVITTNDELGELAPAATRAGRCVSRSDDGSAGPTVFGPLTASEASAWLGEKVDEGGTLADLYARRHDGGSDPLEALEAEPADDEEAAEDPDLQELLAMARRPLQ